MLTWLAAYFPATAQEIAQASETNSGKSEALKFFESRVRPILVEHCYACHSSRSDIVKGGLRLDTKSGWQQGGDSGHPAIVPGESDSSPLIEAIRHQGGLKMPPDKKLPDSVIADLVQWIQQGAVDPRVASETGESDGNAKRADKSWWSLQPVTVHAPPTTAGQPSTWSVNPIDRFIFATLHSQGLEPSGPAETRTLVRRMTYDVTGLPPTVNDIELFETDRQQRGFTEAVERLVDRLLASPRYGEHWGRHWLDVVRFGESIGFERNVIIDDLWPFRDYVIQAFNQDRPFDRVIMEHIAGDVLGKDQPDIEVASAFLVAGPYDDVGNQDPVAQANIRAATLDEIITATSSAFLGMTVNCSRCHHHKFDPIQTEDYYRLRAAFEGVKHGRRVVASTDERQRHAAAHKPLEAELRTIERELERIEESISSRAREELKSRSFPRPKVDAGSTDERFAPIRSTAVRFVMHAHSANPLSAVGSRLVEFEVWSAGNDSHNVALSRLGAKAAGAKNAVAEDFPEAYGPQFTIDGSFAEQWFVGSPAVLTITLAEPTLIDRITFSNSRGIEIQRKGVQGETPTDYEVFVLNNNAEWIKVADSFDRQPWSETHAIERVRQSVTTVEEATRLTELIRQRTEIRKRLDSIPPLRQVFAGNYAQPDRPTMVHQGGDPAKPIAEIAPASLQFAGSTRDDFNLPKDAPESERRLALAKWMVASDHPLTARVLANRIWHYHFGTGIVDSPNDFGFLGGRPTHPELLDWLATRLINHGWRLKPLHREILTSQTYLQSSEFRTAPAAVDRDSRLLWRFPPRRLSAEEIRDTLLVVGGKLKFELGGPGFRLYKFTQNNVCTYFPLDRHGPETYRRTVYHQNARASVVDLLTDFDFPDIAFAAPRRAITTSPLQTLTLFNHSFTLDMANALAQRIGEQTASESGAEHSPGKVASEIRQAYRIALQREPVQEEVIDAEELIAKHGLTAFCRALLNFTELAYIE